MWARASLFHMAKHFEPAFWQNKLIGLCWPYYSVDLRIQTYAEPVPLKYVKLAAKYPWLYDNFIQCRQLSCLSLCLAWLVRNNY